MTIKTLVRHVSDYGGEATLHRWPRRVLWGVAPTGPPHFGYAPFLGLLRHFAVHGAEIILLIANYHGFLDSRKTPLNEIRDKTRSYKKSFTDLQVPSEWLVETNLFYFEPNYFRGLMEFTAQFQIDELFHSAAGTLRSAATNKKTVGDVFYVATQIYDVAHLDVDCVLCGNDEAGIYKSGLPMLETITQKNVGVLYLPIAPGIEKDEMHSSDDPSNKLLLSATSEDIARAFGRSRRFQEYHCGFTMPLLNHRSHQIKEPVHEWLFELLRQRV
jgi:tyrosyl-tRNA synthetase